MTATFSNQQHPKDYFLDSLWIVFTCLTDALPSSEAAVYLYEGEGENLVLQKSSAAKKIFIRSLPADAISDLSKTEESDGQPVPIRISDEEAARFLAGSRKGPDTLVIARSLSADEEHAGLLVVKLPQEPDDKAQVQHYIDQAARMVENNLLLNSKMGAIYAENTFLSDLVSKAGNLDISSTSEVLIDTLVRLVKEAMTFDRFTISTLSKETKERLQIDRVEGLKDDYLEGYTYTTAGVAHGEVFMQARPINIGRLKTSGYKGRFVAGDLKKTPLTSFLGVPLMEAGVPRGILALESVAKDHFSPTDMGILKAISQVYGTALCWSQRYQEVRAIATIDGLTQLLNHRSFMERFGIELERASRYSDTMTFLMLDLDSFKRVNDTHGHLFGDYVLWQTSQLIRSCIRKADIAGRYGGEEFGVVIINADKQSCLSTAERIRKSIAEYQFENQSVKTRISVSIGMSEYPIDGDDINTLIKCADDAMYVVKHRGGNAVISYSEEPENEKKGE
ncbi:MAG: diguanylate cyclase [Fidelibacterota bacterium]|nr:MAG: diguanylate cyclase [Candidatus Neomarinimicrobiota bacterium]